MTDPSVIGPRGLGPLKNSWLLLKRGMFAGLTFYRGFAVSRMRRKHHDWIEEDIAPRELGDDIMSIPNTVVA